MTFLIAFCVSILLTSILVPLFMKVGIRMGILDQPGARKVHTQPIPRTGGAAVIIGSLVPFILIVKNSQLLLGICLGALCILLVGLCDDMWDIDYKWKFFGQFLAAAITLLVCNIRVNTVIELYHGLSINLNVISFPLSLLFLVSIINVFNLADGLDGLAGGSCLLIFCCIAFFAYFREEFLTVALCVCMIGAIIGFLRYNTHPATVFLGDTGSLFLGLMVGVSVTLLTRGECIYSPALSLYIIGVPIMDTSMVILERLMDHHPVFKADKNHLHHKLMKIGFRHSEAVAIIYSMQFLMILLAWNLRFCVDGLLLAIYLLLLGAFLTFFFLHKKGCLSIPPIHRQPDRVDNTATLIKSRFPSTSSVNRMAWYGLMAGMFLFALLCPLTVRPLSRDIGIICCTLILGILLLKILKAGLMKTTAKFAAYFLSLFYISSMESQTSLFPTVFNMLFLSMGICYIFYLVTTAESVPVSTMDYLLLIGVISILFVPRAYPELIHLKNITIRTLFMIFYIELFFFKLKDEKFSFMLWSILFTLGLTCASALLV
ncbi:MAG: MraY family glycosyltransferase [bacterium]